MKHPDQSQWSLFVSGDTAPGEYDELERHRAQCPECAAEVVALKRTIERLQSWEYPREQSESKRRLSIAIRYGIAASLILGLGIAIGRLAAPPQDKVLRAQLAAEWRGEFERSRTESRAELAALEARLKESSGEEMRSTLRQVASAINQAREQDRTAIANEFTNLRREQLANIRWLRRDLETLASRADDEITATQAHLRQLVVSSDPQRKP